MGKKSTIKPTESVEPDSAVTPRNSSLPVDPGTKLFRSSYLHGKDFALSKRLALCGPIDLPHHFVLLRWICRLLEYSGHGVPWFALTVAQTSVAIRWEAVQFWTNMVLGMSLINWLVDQQNCYMADDRSIDCSIGYIISLFIDRFCALINCLINRMFGNLRFIDWWHY